MKAIAKKPLTIGLIIDDAYPDSGGLTRSVQAQVEELTRLGHKVVLFAPKLGTQPPASPLVTTVFVPARRLYKNAPAHFATLQWGSALARRLSKDHHIDVIHSQSERGAMFLAAQFASLQHIPHIHTFHANISGGRKEEKLSPLRTLAYAGLIAPIMSRSSAKEKTAKRPKRPSYKSIMESFNARTDWQSLAYIALHVDAFTTPSYFMMENILKVTKGKGDHAVIPNGCTRDMRAALTQTTPAKRTDGVFRFIFVGRFSVEKRIKTLLQAFIQAAIPDTELVLVGGGSQESTLRKLAKGHANVIFRGHLGDQKQIAKELKNADALVLPSYRFDNQPMVFLEAATAGLPVLYCDDRLDVGVTPENSIVTGHTIAGLARGLKQMARPGVAARLRKGTAAIAKKYTAEAMGKQYVALYQRLIEKLDR